MGVHVPSTVFPTSYLRLTCVFYRSVMYSVGRNTLNSTRAAFTTVAILGLASCTVAMSSVASTSTTSLAAATVPTSPFTASSPVMVDGGIFPKRFTCDGESISPPLSWSGAPIGTRSYAVLMDHQPAPDEWHWYWALWGISASTTSLSAGTTGGAIVGTNSVNPDLAYAPPCSKGPGPKKYTLTVFALSDEVHVTDPRSVDRTVFLATVKPITLARASITVSYSRP